MFEMLKRIRGDSVVGPVFVIGTGRSGTHWLGYSLGDHLEVRSTIEVEPMFGWSTRMALNPALEMQLFDKLVKAYQSEQREASPRLYLDKSHPNIWIAERLKKAFPRSLFVGIERNPYATVASMLKHSGVSAWHDRWQEFPIPNRFLGISKKLADEYGNMPLASQCALRWLAHHDRMNELRTILGDDLLVISYESFSLNTEDTVHNLQQFLGLRHSIPVPIVKTDSLQKWKTQLSDEQIKQIQEVVSIPSETI